MLRYTEPLKRIGNYLVSFFLTGNFYYRRWPLLFRGLRHNPTKAGLLSLWGLIFSPQFKFLEWVALGSGRWVFMGLLASFWTTLPYPFATLVIAQLCNTLWSLQVFYFLGKGLIGGGKVKPAELMALLFLGIAAGLFLSIAVNRVGMGDILCPSRWPPYDFMLRREIWYSWLGVWLLFKALYCWIGVMFALLVFGVCRQWAPGEDFIGSRWSPDALLFNWEWVWLRKRSNRLRVLWIVRHVDRVMVGSLAPVCLGIYWSLLEVLLVWVVVWFFVYFILCRWIRSDKWLYRHARAAGWTGLGALTAAKISHLLLLVELVGIHLLHHLGMAQARALVKPGVTLKAAWLRVAHTVRVRWKITLTRKGQGFQLLVSVTRAMYHGSKSQRKRNRKRKRQRKP